MRAGTGTSSPPPRAVLPKADPVANRRRSRVVRWSCPPYAAKPAAAPVRVPAQQDRPPHWSLKSQGDCDGRRLRLARNDHLNGLRGWQAAPRKGLARLRTPGAIILTGEGLTYETGMGDQILHGSDH